MLKNKEIFGIEKEVRWLEEKTKYNTLSALNIHEGQPDILAYIYLHKKTSQFDIARYLGLSRASIGISLKRMEKNGYICIKQNDENRRSTCVDITEKGIKTLVKADMVLDEFITDKFKDFSEEEIDQYLRLMSKIKHNLSKQYKKSLAD